MKNPPRSNRSAPCLVLTALAVSLCLAFSEPAHALPTDGLVTAGSASVAGTPGKLTITQTSQQAAINWQSFGIGVGESVNFVQPNSQSVALNRVLGSDPSVIMGRLSANGKVFLVNPNGVLFGAGATVNVGGLVASTLGLSNADFMAGRYVFSGTGGRVLNQGTLNADGGHVALLGAHVSNEGVITARLGSVTLAAGKAVTLDVAGDGLLHVTVDQGAVNALVQNSGLIQADGGQVMLTAQAAGRLLSTVVNNTGVIQARTVQNKGGVIKLLGDMDSGTAHADGTLDASAPDGGNGGFIETSAANVQIGDGLRIDTSAVLGRQGTWLIDPVEFVIGVSSGNMRQATLNAALSASDVVIQTSAASGGAGIITVNGSADAGGAVSIVNGANGTRTLTLLTDGTINIHAGASISGSAGHALNVVLNAPGGNTIAGTIDNGGGTTTLTGATTLSGTLRNGTLVSASPWVGSNGVLDGMTLGGASMTVSGDLRIQHDLMLANGLTVNKQGGNWHFDGEYTGQASGTVHHLGTSGHASVVSAGGSMIMAAGNGQTLKIDSGVTVQGHVALTQAGGSTIVNDGTIDANVAGQAIAIDPAHFINNGQIVVNGGALNLASADWHNPGKITVNSGSLSLGGAGFGLPDLSGPAHFARTGGTVSLDTNLDLAGGTLDIGAAQFGTGGLTLLNGVLANGTLVSSDGTTLKANGSHNLDGMTIGSNLTVANALWIWHGLTLANGVTVDKGAYNWYFNGHDSGEASGTVHQLSSTGNAVLNTSGGEILMFAGNGQTLHIGSGVTVQGFGNLSENWGGSIINDGILKANTVGQSFSINNTQLFNNGELVVNGGSLNLNVTSWTNPGKVTLGSGVLNLAGAFSLADLSGPSHFVRTGGSVNLNGFLDLVGGTLDIGAAQFGMGGLTALNGTLANGTLISSDGTVLNTSGNRSLDGMTIGSDLTVATDMHIWHGLTLANGVTVDKGARNWYFNGHESGEASGTVHHLSSMGNAVLNMAGGEILMYAGNGQTLHIGSGVTVQGFGNLSENWGGAIINDGVLKANTAGQAFSINNTHLFNNGDILINGGTFNLNVTSWTNPGKVTLGSGVLNLAGAFSLADLSGASHFVRTGGSVNLNGFLDLAGGTLDIGAAQFGMGGLTALNGTLANGTLISSDGTVLNTSGNRSLDGMTIGSDLTVATDMHIWHGLTLANGVTVDKGARNWYFNGHESGEASGTVHHLSSTGNAVLNMAGGEILMYAGNGQTLHIDSGITVQGHGNLSENWGGAIINDGVLKANTVGQAFSINNTHLFNNGDILVDGGTLNLNVTSWTNPGKITLNSGVLNLAGAFSLADLSGASHFVRTGGSVNLNATLNLAGGTLDIGAAQFGAGGLTALNGTLLNGTLISSDGTVLKTSGNHNLDGMTIGSDLTLAGDLWIWHGLTLANGVTVDMGAHTWYLNGHDSGEVAGTVHHLGSPGSATVRSPGGSINLYAANGQVLQIDAGVTLTGHGSLAQTWGGSTLVNQGRIHAATAGQGWAVNFGGFTNAGTLQATVGGSLNISASSLLNTGTGVIDGAFNIDVGSFTSDGLLAGNGNVRVAGGGGTFINNGVLAPGLSTGNPTGLITITGNLFMGAGSSLNVDINSPLSGDYDVLSVSGSADLSLASLNLAGIGGVGSHTIVQAAGGLSGSGFMAVHAGSFSLTPGYTANGVAMVITANSQSAIGWDGGAGTANWDDALNWSNDLVPTSGDDLYIGAGAGTVWVSAGTQFAHALVADAHFHLSGGTLDLATTSTLRRTTTISGGTLTGTGTVIIPAGATLNWSGGTIDGTSAASLLTQAGATANVTGGALGGNRDWLNSGTLNIAPAAWSKSGTLTHAAGTLSLDGNFNLADVFAFQRTGGSVNLNGVLDLMGGTLDIGAARFGTGGLSRLNGTLLNGTLVSGDGTALSANSIRSLDGMTIGSDLTVNGDLYMWRGLTLANGVTVDKGAASWFFNGEQSGEAAGTVHHLGSTGQATLTMSGGQIMMYAGNGQTLRIDSGVTVQGFGTLAENWGGAIVNDGTLLANVSGQAISVNPTHFTNNGDIILNGGDVAMNAGQWTNPGKITVTSGNLSLAGGGFTLADISGAAHFSRTDGTVALNATLDLAGGTLDIGAAQFGTGGLTRLNGTLLNGTVVSLDGTPLRTGGGRALDGMTIGSDMTVSGDLFIWHDLTLADGVTVDKGGSNWYFNGQDSGEAAGTVHHLGSTGQATLTMSGGQIMMYAGNGQTLRIDSGVTVQGFGTLAENWGGAIVNDGTLLANVSGQAISVNPTHFTNNGDIVLNGGDVAMNAGQWTNPGKITVTSGSLSLAGGGFTLADISGAAHFSRTGGTVALNATLDLAGGTLDIGAAQFGTGGLTRLNGTLLNGTVVSLDGTPLRTGGGRALDGMTIGSDMTVSGDLFIWHDLTLADGVTVDKGGSNWYFNGQDSGEAAGTVHHLGSTGQATLTMSGGQIMMYAGNGQTLRIDSGVTVQGFGALAENWGGAIVNDGTLLANVSGQAISVNPTHFTNNGDIVLNGGDVAMNAGQWTNPGKITVTSGNLSLAGGGFTLADISGAAHFSRTGGTVALNATLDLAGGTLDIGAAQFGTGGLTGLNGTLLNGTLVSGDGTVLVTGGNRNLDGIVIGSDLTVGSDLWIWHGLSLADGITVDMGGRNWYFNGHDTGEAPGTVQHLSTSGHATVNLAGGGLQLYAANGQTLRLDSGLTVQGPGNLGQIWGGGNLVNDGTLRVSGAGQALNVNFSTFTSNGTIDLTGGAQLHAGNGFTQAGTLSGWGTVNVGTGAAGLVNRGTLDLGGTGTLGTLLINGDLLLDTGTVVKVDLGGAQTGQFDQIVVNGAVSGMGGSFGDLTLARVNGYTFVNVLGDELAVLTASSGADSATFNYPGLLRSQVTSNASASQFNLVITPMRLTVQATAGLSKVFDSAEPTFTYTVSGFDGATADDATSALSGVLLRTTGRNVGSYDITQGFLMSPLGYAVNFLPGTTFSITPKTVSLSASKTYDGGLDLSGKVSIATGVGSETLGYTGAAANSKDVAANAVNFIGALTLADATDGSGGLAINYQLPTLDQAHAPVTIAAKAISASGLTAADKVYDATTAATLAAGTGALIDGATTVGDEQVYTGDLVDLVTTGATGAYLNKDVGNGKTLTVSGLGLAGADAGNYTLLSATGTGNITPKVLSISGLTTPLSKVYDGTTAAAVSGTPTLASAESVGAGSATDGRAYLGDVVAITGSATGTYNDANVLLASTVTFAGLALDNGNYSLALPGPAAATITPRALTATATAADKVYDGHAAASPVLVITAGLVGMDTLVATATGSFNTKDVDTANLVTVGSVMLADGAGLASNYSLAAGQTASARITPKTLTVTANDASKVQGAVNPALAATIGGFVSAEDLSTSGVTGEAELATAATLLSDPGLYAITAAIGHLNAINYGFAFVSGELTVRPAPWVVPADNTAMAVASALSVASPGPARKLMPGGDASQATLAWLYPPSGRQGPASAAAYLAPASLMSLPVSIIQFGIKMADDDGDGQ